MRKFSAAAVAVVALAGTAVAVSASPAFAASTYTVTGGGAVTGTASGSGLPVLTDTATGTTLKCTSASIGGTIPNGTGLAALDLGQLTSVSFGGCSVGGAFSFTVTPEFPPNNPPTTDPNWDFNADGNPTVSGVTHGNVSFISADISGTGCTADVDGTTTDAGNGSVSGSYTNSSGALTATNSPGLKIFNVVGCGGLINNNDAATFSATYIVKNSSNTHPQITSSP
jgi:hypothetical protein